MSQAADPLPQVTHQRAIFADGLMLDCGATVAPLAVAWRGYGRLNADATNAI
ncbi:MAG: homoserine O-acetyltransferase, partial [Rhodospirillales bacterium]|nr:homoserine O-acetyltransferase [Rhodospirillales bacterium]